MNFRFSTAAAALGCILLASCYPYEERPRRRPEPNPRQKSISSGEQQKIKEQRDRMKAEDALKKKETIDNPGSDNNVGTIGGGTPGNGGGTVTPPVEEKRPDIPVAEKVPGKEGYVFSPFNTKLIDVRGIPGGTLVADPTYPESAKKHFRVP